MTIRSLCCAMSKHSRHQVRQRIYQFVAKGGGLLFFAGNRVDPVRYNAMFYRSDTLVLPLALGQPIQRPQDQPMTIATVHSTGTRPWPLLPVRKP